MRAAVLMLAAACRIHFDPLGGTSGDDGGADSLGDDGIGSDVSGFNGGCVIATIPLPDSAGGDRVDGVWTGSRLGLTWTSGTPGSVYFATFDSAGTSIIAPTIVGSGSTPTLALVGDRWWLSWSNAAAPMAQMMVRPYSLTGQPLDNATFVTDAVEDAWWQNLQPRTGGLGFVYSAGFQPSEVYYEDLDPFGVRVGSVVQLTSGPGTRSPTTLQWTGSRNLLVYATTNMGGSDTDFFARWIQSATSMGADVRIDSSPAGVGGSETSAWNGSELATVWSIGPSNTGYFQRVDGMGALKGPMATLGTIAFRGQLVDAMTTGYGLLFGEQGRTDLEFATLGTDGTPQNDAHVLCTDAEPDLLRRVGTRWAAVVRTSNSTGRAIAFFD